ADARPEAGRPGARSRAPQRGVLRRRAGIAADACGAAGSAARAGPRRRGAGADPRSGRAGHRRRHGRRDRLEHHGAARRGPARAATGRVNLVAGTAGLLRVDRAGVDALNGADEALTLATLPDWSSVTAGEMVATIKVIPFAVRGDALARAIEAAGAARLRVLP